MSQVDPILTGTKSSGYRLWLVLANSAEKRSLKSSMTSQDIVESSFVMGSGLKAESSGPMSRDSISIEYSCRRVRTYRSDSGCLM